MKNRTVCHNDDSVSIHSSAVSPSVMIIDFYDTGHPDGSAFWHLSESYRLLSYKNDLHLFTSYYFASIGLDPLLPPDLP